MKITLKNNIFSQVLILIPFFLVFVSSPIQFLHKELGTALKLLAVVYMIGFVFVKNTYNKNLVIATLLFIPFLVYGILISFSIKAGLSDGLRYLFPVVVLFYGFSARNFFGLLLKFIIVFVIINFLAQFVNYYYWLKGETQWFYHFTDHGLEYYHTASNILRATGIVGFFGFFGFLNIIAFFVLHKFYHGKGRPLLLIITIFCVVASFSFKGIAAFLMVLFVYYYKHLIKILGIISVLIVSFYFIAYKRFQLLIDEFLIKIQVYITEGQSARSESYRVMFDEIANFNLFGKGVGVFGGPASTTYNSPYYGEVGFNWYGIEWMNLTTTDTYPPHLFVELGIIGGLSYLLLLTVPLLRKKINSGMKLILVIYFCLFVDMLFSFSLNNLEYLMFSLVFVYPIFQYSKQLKGDRELKP